MEASLPLRHDPARSAHWKFGRTTSLFFVFCFVFLVDGMTTRRVVTEIVSFTEGSPTE
jgi:hypothetical protein